MQVLLPRFFSLFFSDVVQCAQFVCTFENLCHILSRKWQWQSGSTVLDTELESCHSLSLMDCSLVRFLCATPSTSFTDSKLGPVVSSDILKYHRRWGPARISGSCGS